MLYLVMIVALLILQQEALEIPNDSNYGPQKDSIPVEFQL